MSVSKMSKPVCWILLVEILSGCAASEVIVPIRPAQEVTRKASNHVRVQVTDIRKEANLERTTIGGISMGKITLDPPVPELVRVVIEARADEALMRSGLIEPRSVMCGIRVFDVSTPATMLYWDVTTKIGLVLRVGGQDREINGSAAERTFVWPSDDIIKRVTQEALRQVSAEADQALAELFAGSR